MGPKTVRRTYKRLFLALLLTALLGFGVLGLKWYERSSASMPKMRNIKANDTAVPTVAQREAQAFIEAAEDKSKIPKYVWLASGMTEREYKVIWEDGTERSGSSPLNKEQRPGKYITKACGLEVFSSEHKYDSGTGWPSFYEANKENLVLKDDYSWLGIKRIEVESKCGEHLGHVFEDGPAPTGLRYCMNGAALLFVPDQEAT